MSQVKFQTSRSIESYLDKLSENNIDQGMLPVFYELDANGKLMLYGTDNISEIDEHNICRLAGNVVHYEGPVELRGHIADGGIVTRGNGSNIRVTGYICGDSDENPAQIVARDSAISLGDTHHPERRNIVYAHLEAAHGITVYKRPLIHVSVLSHDEDAVLRGQMMEDVDINAPYLSLSTSIGNEMHIKVKHDAVMKGSKFMKCDIESTDGEIFISAGSIRECKIHAKYDVEIIGCADEYTLKNAVSEKGEVRHDGEPRFFGKQRQRA